MTTTSHMDTRDLIESASRSLFPNYNQFPVVFVRGENCRLWDSDGREYIDFVAGIATCNLGHCHPDVTAAIRDQAAKLVHISNWYFSAAQAELSVRLTGLTPLNRVFLCNSGAEASEAAIKLARKRAYEKFGPGRNTIISLLGAFHGRTMKALTATDPKHHLEAFSPYPGGFVHISPDDVGTLKKHLPGACALFMETIQGEGGVRPVAAEFIREAAALCREHDVLLMIDEVQTGMGRCGAMFAHQLLDIEPDVLTLAKGLGNGFPIGAVLASDRTASYLGPGTHGSTFGGNPLASAAALATMDAIIEQELPSRASRMGRVLRDGLNDLVARSPMAVTVRGEGLLLGLELAEAARPVVQQLMEKGFLVTAVQERTLRFTPPLTIGEEEIGEILATLGNILPGSGDSSHG